MAAVMRLPKRCLSALIAAMLLDACGGTPTASTPTVRAVTVSGRDLYMGFVTSEQFTAAAVLADGTIKDVTAEATWQSSNTTIASVTPTGEVKAVDLGNATITARYQNVIGAHGVAVRCGVFLNIVPSGPLQVSAGSTTRVQTYADFVAPMYEQVLATLSSSRPEVAAVARVAQTADWTLTAIAPGQTTIHATYQCGTADLVVTITATQ